MQKNIKLVELFSGIGSQLKALENIGQNVSVLNTCEWNIHAFMAYAAIHDMKGKHENVHLSKDEIIDRLVELGVSTDGKEPASKTGLQTYNEECLKKIYATVESTRNLVDISKVSGESLSGDIDIMTYSFPCQDLSNVGALHGYNKGIDRNAGSRSGLLWEVERILLERQKKDLYLPHFLLMENVPALNSQRHIKNFEEWQRQLNSLGYYNKQFLLNAKDFGLPQNRERLLMLSVLTNGDPDVEKLVKQFFNNNKLQPNEYLKKQGKGNLKLKDYLKTDYSISKYYKEALECQPNNTVSRQKIWEENAQLTDEYGNVKDTITSTLTTKQDRHPNSGNLKVDFKNGKANFRYLTPRECFMLMGFTEDDFERVLNSNFTVKKNSKLFTRDNLIKMSGNSIAVNVLEAIFLQVMELDRLLYI